MKTRLLVGITLLVGCGGSSVGIEDFPNKYAQAICSKNFTCCDASELAGKTMSTCVTDNQTFVSLFIGEINSSQAQGRVSYDAKQSGTCIDSLKAMSCDEFRQQGIGGNMAACMAFIMPKVAQGGACTQDFECTTGNCDGADTSATPAVDGMCIAAPIVAAIGQGCAANDCVDGAYCDDSTVTCLPLKGAGAACTSDSECINTCNTTTNTCTCYAGCAVGAPTTTQGTLLSLLLVAAGLVVTRVRRRRG
jgi:hypothetical protein